jgi:hypothetical protein
MTMRLPLAVRERIDAVCFTLHAIRQTQELHFCGHLRMNVVATSGFGVMRKALSVQRRSRRLS